nr:sushi, von Willebrand factor type A, EGF and pentraxin domain-containing protein 1-like [Parasteatoda tepidariorum]
MKTIGKCDFKKKGDICKVDCEANKTLIGDNTMTCLENRKWTVPPKCAAMCPMPKLPEYLTLKSTCSLKISGESCEVNCAQDGSIIGKPIITCQNKREWSKWPDCTCPIPKLTEHVKMLDDCKNRKANENCSVSCQENQRLIGQSVLTCLGNRKWSTSPECAPLCSLPKLPFYLILKINCSARIIGETCEVSCVEKRQVVGNSTITCLTSTKWSTLPKCTCPPPTLTGGVINLADCDTKKIGEVCKVSCRKNSKMIGNNLLTCLENTTWSTQPKCDMITCSNPVLPPYLVFKQNCFSKLIGESCELRCEQKGNMVGEAVITCVGEHSWSKLPDCTCPLPHLSADLHVTTNCASKKKGEFCKLKCSSNKRLIGNNSLTCLESRNWSSPPTCSTICSVPKLPEYLALKDSCDAKIIHESCEVKCAQNGTLIGRSAITCESADKWGDLPDCTCPHPDLYVDVKSLENCNLKKSTEKCAISCQRNQRLIGQGFLTCLENRKWSVSPKCATLCSIPTLPFYLKMNSNCSFKIVGEKCELSCVEKRQVVGNSTIICLTPTKWSTLPKCTCPPPTLTGGVINLADCNTKKIGEICKVGCRKNSKLIGKNLLTCLENTTWSTQPKCDMITCSNPVLPAYLAFKQNCFSKLIGESCELRCEQKGNMVGEAVITCVGEHSWSKLPDCTCPLPHLSADLQVTTNCASKKKGEFCKLKCSSNKRLIGNNSLTCLESRNWSSPPTCATICSVPKLPEYLALKDSCNAKIIHESCEVKCAQKGKLIGKSVITCMSENDWDSWPDCTCPLPSLSVDLKTIENCGLKREGHECKITCIENKRLIGKNTLTCLKNRMWSTLPKCAPICSVPKLPEYLALKGSCSLKIVGESCEVKCAQGGHFIGKTLISCLNENDWGEWPDCTCPLPVLPPDLKSIGNCDLKKQGDNCKLTCSGNQRLIGTDTLTCLGRRKWSTLPKCAPICAIPKLPKYLFFKQSCSLKIAGETCELRCAENSKIIGKNVITCLSENNWGELPDCTCPPPFLSTDLKALEDCDFKKEVDVCRIDCKGHQRLIGKNVLTCLESRKWSTLPKCAPICSIPKLPEFLSLKDECSLKIIGESCEIRCAQNGKLVGKPKITCLSENDWGEYPDCTCPLPALPADLKTSENCNLKNVGSICKVRCNVNQKLIGKDILTCLKSRLWSEIPKCAVICSVPKLPFYLELKKDCSSQIVGESCEISCVQMRQILGNNIITCISPSQWSSPPKCTCPPPTLTGGVINLSDCNKKKTGEICKVGCRKNSKMIGNNLLTCLENTTWSTVPKCDMITCSNPILPEYLAFKVNCFSKLIGEKCEVQCKQSGNIIGLAVITCLSEHQWSKFPDCTCPLPLLSKDIEIIDDCVSKKKGDVCKLKCKGNSRLIGQNTLVCLENRNWSPSPTCALVCSSPKLPGYLVLKESCHSKISHESCEVKCAQKGNIIGKPIITCVDGKEWGDWPDCTCPLPSLSADLHTRESCESKKEGELCRIACIGNQRIIGERSLTCLKSRIWSQLPKCEPICSTPKPPEYLTLKGICSLKIKGELCEVGCVQNGKIIGMPQIECLNERDWGGWPDCTCPLPSLPADLKTVGNCELKKQGDACNIECKGNQRLIGRNTLTCLKTRRWSMPPKCAQICSVPKLPEYLSLEESCSAKIMHESCKVKCVQNGTMIGKSIITCVSETNWDESPECTCPSPVLSSGLKTTENCNLKTEGDVCRISCNENQRLIGQRSLTCLKSRKWSPLPKCIPLCAIPKLPDYLVFKSSCSSKISGESCEVTCSQNGNIIGSHIITCLTENKWSELPDCTCPSPFLSADLKTTENCANKKQGSVCRIGCNGNQRLLGKNFLTCQKDRKWSDLPKCAPICNTPILPAYLALTESCSSKIVRESCKVKCTQNGTIVGRSAITCLSVNDWSEWPDCTCPHPVLSSDLSTLEKCDSKREGDACKIGCRGNRRLIGQKSLMCLTSRTWSMLPTCAPICSTLKLPEYLAFKSNCSLKIADESCDLRCAQNGTIVGNPLITCVNERDWSKFPDCTCPSPALSKGLHTKENCDLKRAGENCRIGCEENQRLIGQGTIMCLTSRKWSPLSKCALICSVPLLPEHLAFTADCSLKIAGEVCEVKCSQKGNVVGDPRIKCLSEKNWSSLPDCTCPSPPLSGGLQSTENCDKKREGDVCRIDCNKNQRLIGQKTIMCLKSRIWSGLPKCALMCSAPRLPEYLVLKVSCSSKITAESCDLRCSQNGKIIGKPSITCLDGKNWSEFPDCTCPSPHLSLNLQTAENCDMKGEGEFCSMICQGNQRLIGPRSITCLKNRLWSSLPKCAPICSLSIIPQYLTFVNICSSKIAGESCEVSCSQKGTIIGKPLITCLNERNWSEFPDCTCPSPSLSEGLRTTEKCNMKRQGDVCEMGCNRNQRLIGQHSIKCLENRMWSTLPKCALICPTPVLPEYLTLKSGCSLKITGESCEAMCTQNGKIIGRPMIVCLNGKYWSDLPDCTCPIPLLSGSLKAIENCDFKKQGEGCEVSCDQNQRLIGQQILTCLKSRMWSVQPTCAQICSKPTLPDYLVFKGTCNSKIIHETCEVRCSQNGKIIGNPILTCLSEKNWTEYPDCTCSSPILSEELLATENCDSKRHGHTCKIECNGNRRLVGQNALKCLESRLWSTPPKCVLICPVPELPEYLNFKFSCILKIPGEYCEIMCTQNGNIVGIPKVTCINEKKWTEFPDCTCPSPLLSGSLKITENCDGKKKGDTCRINCQGNRRLIGLRTITCQKNRKWSTLPRCALICPVPALPEYLALKFSCSSKIVGESCEVKCSQNGNIVGRPIVTCVNERIWSELPDCTCPSPVLSAGLQTTENCDRKREGDVCKLGCNKNQRLIGQQTMTCLKSRMWTTAPECAQICSVPILPEYLAFKISCSLKIVGESCEIRCTQNGNVIGTSSVTCLNERKWSDFPDCTCPSPHLSGSLKTSENCDAKKEGDVCTIGCLGNQRLIGLRTITCLKNRKWSALPRCALICSAPELPEYLDLKLSCSSKIVGESCEVRCIQNGNIAGSPIITCLNERTWSKFPDCTCPSPALSAGLQTTEDCGRKREGDMCKLNCNKNQRLIGQQTITCLKSRMWSSIPKCAQICSSPTLPTYLAVKYSCSLKIISESCELKCSQNGNIIGSPIITCLNEKTWSKFPDCTCPSPVLSAGLQTSENCERKREGDMCKLSCNRNQRLIGQQTITCLRTRMWSNTPKCAQICSVPTLPTYLAIKYSCSSKIISESCELKCSQNGNIIGSLIITCLNERTWSKFPDCTCPSPALTAGLQTTENCDRKKEGDMCKLSCNKNQRLIGQQTITCLRTRMWSNKPKCALICSAPTLPTYLAVKFSCSLKIISESCELKCSQNGNIIGSPIITCLNERTWSKFPDCTCPLPVLSTGLQTTENCDNKREGNICKLKCSENQRLIGQETLTCLKDRVWSISPKCAQVCSIPILPQYLSFKVKCSSKIVGESCEVMCSQKGNIVGNPAIKCLSTGNWSMLPDCTCPSLYLSGDLQTADNCNLKKKGEVCVITCKKNQKIVGPNILKCEENRKWSSTLPKCSSMCSEPKLPTYLNLRSKCTSKVVGETCRLTCSQGGKLIAKSQIQCLLGSNWSSFPECTCPNPVLPRKLNIIGKCESKRRGQTCTIGCKRHYKLKGSNQLTCGINAKWNFRALCVTRCRKPKLPFYLILTENCSSKGVGDSCNVNCRNKGQMIGNAKIMCLKMHKWTSFPDCLCPSPIFTHELEASENCNMKRRGEVCKIRCKGYKKIRGHKTIMCFNSTRWSSLRSTQCISPKCRTLFLPPFMKFEPACVNPVVGKSCSIVCTQGGRIVGNKVITCLSNATWSALPSCTCPQPRLNPDLAIVPKQCRDLRRGSYCQLTCRDRKKRIEGDGRMRCQRNARWPRFPKCRTVCPEPKWFKTWLRSDSTCKNIAIGERCVLRCKWEKEGSKFIQGINYMICLQNLTWSKMPECYCPPPVMPEGMILKQDCSKLIVGNRCPVGCAAGYHLKNPNLNYLYCTSSTSTWGQWPVCLKT